MEAFTEGQLIFKGLYKPFNCWETWPVEDEQLDYIEIGAQVSWLPYGDPRKDEPDPFVTMMQEAYRCIRPGGMLDLRVPNCLHGAGIGFPLQQRVFNKNTFASFGVPLELMENASRDELRWDAFGADLGCRFDIVHVAEDGYFLECTYEKPLPDVKEEKDAA